MPFTVICSGCGQKAVVPVSATGAVGKCRKCGQRVNVPPQSLFDAGDTALNAAPPDPDERLSRKAKLGIASIASIGVLIIATLVHVLFVRDWWENQNHDHLLALKAEADLQIRQDRLRDAEAKFVELFGVVGARVIRDAELREQLNTARASMIVVEDKLKIEDQRAAQQRLREQVLAQAERQKEELEKERLEIELAAAGALAHQTARGEEVVDDPILSSVVARYPEFEGPLKRRSPADVRYTQLTAAGLVAAGKLSLREGRYISDWMSQTGHDRVVDAEIKRITKDEAIDQDSRVSAFIDRHPDLRSFIKRGGTDLDLPLSMSLATGELTIGDKRYIQTFSKRIQDLPN